MCAPPAEVPPPTPNRAPEPNDPEMIAQRFHSLMLGILQGIKDLDRRVRTLEAAANRREKGGGF